MKNNIFLVVTSLMLLISCSKDKGNNDPPKAEKGELLRRIEWDIFSSTGDVKYNTDSTLQKILYTNPTRNTEVNFTYDNKKRVTKINSPELGRYADYIYDDKNRITQIGFGSNYPGSIIYLEFTYNAANRVKQLEYRIVNEAGTKVQWTSDYEYNAEGLLSKVVSTSANGSSVTYTLENYSEACTFNPFVFIQTLDVGERYELYNYPIVSQMNKFPGKVTKTSSTSGAVESITESTYTIQNKRLNKTDVKITYPQSSQSNTQYEIKYFY